LKNIIFYKLNFLILQQPQPASIFIGRLVKKFQEYGKGEIIKLKDNNKNIKRLKNFITGKNKKLLKK